MTFEDWVRAQIDLRATVSIRLGQAQDGSHASIMTWSDKVDGTHFWKVTRDRIEHLQFIGND